MHSTGLPFSNLNTFLMPSVDVSHFFISPPSVPNRIYFISLCYVFDKIFTMFSTI